MPSTDNDAEYSAIRTLIGAHFEGLRWTATTKPDWDSFGTDFLPEGSLFGAARPVRRQTLDAFIARMNGLSQILQSRSPFIEISELHRLPLCQPVWCRNSPPSLAFNTCYRQRPPAAPR